MTLLAFALSTLLSIPSHATGTETGTTATVVDNTPTADASATRSGNEGDDGPIPFIERNKIMEGIPPQAFFKVKNKVDQLFEYQRDHRLSVEEFRAKANEIAGNDAGARLIFAQISKRYSELVTAQQPVSTVDSTPGNVTGEQGSLRPPKLKPVPVTGDPIVDSRVQIDNALYHNDPRNPAFAGNMGVNYYQNGDYKAAISALEYSVGTGKGTSEQLVAYGGSAYQLKDYETARAAAEKALEMDPSNEAAQTILKLSHDKPSEASIGSALKRAGISNPGKLGGGAADQAASMAGAFGDGSRQAAMMGSASNVDPIEQARRAELAAAAARQQVVPPSKIEQSAAVGKEAAHSLQIGDYPGAYTRASEAIELNNQNAQAWNYRAMAATNMQRYSDAVYDASYSINLEGKQAPPWVTRSWAFAKQGKYKEAEYDARVALEKAPDNAYAYHDLAYALAGEGRRDEALDALRRAAAQDARFQGKLQKALQLAQNEDMTLLFADTPAQASPAAGAAAAAAPASPASKRGRFLRLFLLSISGGLLVALGVLHVVSASWREKVNATIRRVLSSTADGAASASAAGGATAPIRGPASNSAFWEQYDLIGELGAGGMGLVYQARDRSLDRLVAVKKMRDEIRLDPLERQRFIQEARMVAALHHPNIVDIYNIVEDGQDAFLVFEYVSGKTLGQRLNDGPMSFVEARAVMAGVCSAVEYAHKQKIIHRDLKPSNIMISAEGAVKVMDFGVARQAKDAMTKMSMTNTVVGTPPYMAPEQEQGTVRVESDVFALGVVLYESLCGELPFIGVGAGMLLNKINGKHEPLSKRCAQPLPAGLDEVVAKALNPDPDKRYRTPSELMKALDGLQVPSQTAVV